MIIYKGLHKEQIYAYSTESKCFQRLKSCQNVILQNVILHSEIYENIVNMRVL